MQFEPAYPTPEHEAAAQSAVRFFAGRPEISAVLLTCSCARGQASRDSCLDMLALLAPGTTAEARAELERAWEAFLAQDPACTAVAQVGAYSGVELDLHDGRFPLPHRGPTDGPDAFELEIGNVVVYTAPLLEQDDHYRRLRAQWLPYYGDDLRRARLAEVRRFCLNNLDHLPVYLPRGLYFQCFRRFYDAFREFLQGLFIARRTYPIAYDKWIRTQVADILGEPELYAQLPHLLEISHFESDEIAQKAEVLRGLLEEYVVE
jgi:hypothetical protein